MMSDMRIGGLASGMDTDKIISDLMKAERMPLKKMEQEQTSLEWKRDDYREVNTKLLGFREELVNMKLSGAYRARTTSSTHENLASITATSAASETGYSLQSVSQLATSATKVNSDTLFNTKDQISASQSFAELEASGSLATSGSWTWQTGSVEKYSTSIGEATATPTVPLKEGASIQNPLSEMMVKVDGKRFDVVATEAEIDENSVMVDASTGELSFATPLESKARLEVSYVADRAVESSVTGADTNTFTLKKEAIVPDSLTVTVDGASGTATYTTDANGDIWNEAKDAVIGKLDAGSGKITFNEAVEAKAEVTFTYQENYTTSSLGAHTSDGPKEELFFIQASDSVNDFVKDVNDADTGVRMFFDDFTGQVSVSRTETGNFNGQGSGSAGYGQNADHQEIFTSGAFIHNGLLFGGVEETGGANAKLELNSLQTERSSNNFSMNGVTFNLKDTFGAPGTNNPGTSGVNLSVSNDTEAVFENIKNFVDKYNETIEFLNDKVSEEFYRDYKPLSDEEREAMTDKQGELWDEKAQSGLLRNDRTIRSALSEMRQGFYTPVSNPEISSEFQQLSRIGITTTSNYLEGGKLKINEAELKKAIQEDPESVEKLFTSSDEDYGRKGIVQRVYDSTLQTMEKITDKAGNQFQSQNQYSIGKDLKGLKEEMSDFENRLNQIEDRYWREFGAMEKAIQKMNQQSAYIMQNFSY